MVHNTTDILCIFITYIFTMFLFSAIGAVSENVKHGRNYETQNDCKESGETDDNCNSNGDKDDDDDGKVEAFRKEYVVKDYDIDSDGSVEDEREGDLMPRLEDNDKDENKPKKRVRRWWGGGGSSSSRCSSRCTAAL